MNTIYQRQNINIAVENPKGKFEIIETTIEGETEYLLKAASELYKFKSSNQNFGRNDYNSLGQLMQILRSKYSPSHIDTIILKFTLNTFYKVQEILEDNCIACY